MKTALKCLLLITMLYYLILIIRVLYYVIVGFKFKAIDNAYHKNGIFFKKGQIK